MWLLSLPASTAKQQRNCIKKEKRKQQKYGVGLHIHQYKRSEKKNRGIQQIKKGGKNGQLIWNPTAVVTVFQWLSTGNLSHFIIMQAYTSDLKVKSCV